MPLTSVLIQLSVNSNGENSLTTNQTLATTSTNAAAEKKAYVAFRDFNTFSCQARVNHTEVRSGDNGEYVTVTAITNLKDGEKGVAIRFSSSNGILKLAKNGHLMNGRRIHVTGSVSHFETHYVDKKTGEIVVLERARLGITSPSLILGAKPKDQ